MYYRPDRPIEVQELSRTNPFLTEERAASIVHWMRGTTPLHELEAGRKWWIATKPRSLAMLRRLRNQYGLKRDDQGRIVGINTGKPKRQPAIVIELAAVVRQFGPDHPILSKLAA